MSYHSVQKTNNSSFFHLPNISPKAAKMSAITAVALIGIALASTGLGLHFGMGLLNVPITSAMGASGGALALGSLIAGILVNRHPSWTKNLNLGKDRQVSLSLANWNLGTTKDAAIAKFFAETGKHPDCLEKMTEEDNAWFEEILEEEKNDDSDRTGLFKQSFASLANMGEIGVDTSPDIFCFQECQYADPRRSLFDELSSLDRAYDKSETHEQTLVMWKKDKFKYVQQFNIGKNAGVLLKEKESKLKVFVLSCHLSGFDLNGTGEYGDDAMKGGNDELVEIRDKIRTRISTDVVTIVAGDYNCPRLEVNDPSYSQIGVAQREQHRTRHKILEKDRYKTSNPSHPTNLNKKFGEIPMDYQYILTPKGADVQITDKGLPPALRTHNGQPDWSKSPSDHAPLTCEVEVTIQ